MLHCLVQVVLLRKFCFIEHVPIQSYELVNECIGISGVHQTSTALCLRISRNAVECEDGDGNMLRTGSYRVWVFPELVRKSSHLAFPENRFRFRSVLRYFSHVDYAVSLRGCAFR